MTEKIFYSDPHEVAFDATVISCSPTEDGAFQITLDRTAFFPEEGGQNADSGFINGIEVLDVQLKENVIYHKMPVALAPGDTVKGNVDWDKRFDYMQQHSGEHLISGLVNHHYGFHNVGFHLGDEEVTLDFDGILTLEELRKIETEANKTIAKIFFNISHSSFF